MAPSGLNIDRLNVLKAHLEETDCILREPGEFCNIRLTLKDDDHEYLLPINAGQIESIRVDQPRHQERSDVILCAPSKAWAEYLQEVPPPKYSDIKNMVTEKVMTMHGDIAYFQNIEFITGMMRYLGHRTVLSVQNGENPNNNYENGYIESTVGRYVHLKVNGHIWRVFFEESGPADGVPLVLLHAANSDARMWRHQLHDPDFNTKYRVLAFDMPWRGRSIPPQELLRTEYLLTCDFYMKIVRGFCEALALDRPVIIGCSMGGYLAFHLAHKQRDYYRALIAVAGRDFENRRWALEKILRHPAISFGRYIGPGVRGFMAPQDPVGCADETTYVYETGNARALRGDLHFAALDADARSFMADIDTKATPFYLLAGEYDWSCTQEHTDAIKSRMPGIEIVRMKDIGHFPPDENPKVFKSYLLPALKDALARVRGSPEFHSPKVVMNGLKQNGFSEKEAITIL